MNRIEQELGLVSDEQQEEIDKLINRPDHAEEEHLDQLKRAAQIEISLSKFLTDLNQQEKSITEEHAQAILSTRNMIRKVVFDRWTTILEISQPDNRLLATSITVCLKLYQETSYIAHNLSPAEDLKGQITQFIKTKDIDLQAVAYGRKYHGLFK